MSPKADGESNHLPKARMFLTIVYVATENGQSFEPFLNIVPTLESLLHLDKLNPPLYSSNPRQNTATRLHKSHSRTEINTTSILATFPPRLSCHRHHTQTFSYVYIYITASSKSNAAFVPLLIKSKNTTKPKSTKKKIHLWDFLPWVILLAEMGALWWNVISTVLTCMYRMSHVACIACRNMHKGVYSTRWLCAEQKTQET